MSVINHLREIRMGKGLTQKEVADALSISKDSLSRYETGKQDPRLDVAIRLPFLKQLLQIIVFLLFPLKIHNKNTSNPPRIYPRLISSYLTLVDIIAKYR